MSCTDGLALLSEEMSDESSDQPAASSGCVITELKLTISVSPLGR